MLKETVHPWVAFEAEPDGITFQQDGARSYMVKFVQDWCQANFKKFAGLLALQIGPCLSRGYVQRPIGVWRP